nr:O-antigen ligase family protein [uncultured Fluviicola sp.]
MKALDYIKKNQVFLFFTILIFFPTIRLLVLGSSHASGIGVVFSVLPELLFSLILLFAFTQFWKTKDRTITLLDKLVLGYFLFNVIIGVYLAHDLKASIYGFRLSYFPMLAYFVGSFYWDRSVDIEKLFRGFFKILIVVAVIGFLLYFVFPDLHLYFHKMTTDKPMARAFGMIVRMTSILWTPVVFGVLMMTAFCYWAYNYFKTGNKWDLLYTFVVTMAMMLSISRGPIIASVIGFLVLAVISRNIKRILVIFGLIALSVSMTFLVLMNRTSMLGWIVESSKETISLEKGNTRVDLWYEVASTLKHNPMGLGLGKAGHAAVQNFPPDTPGVSFASTDGWYFKLMIETGGIALALYLIMALFFFVAMIRYVRRNSFDFVSFILTLFITIGFVNIVSNVLDFYLFSYLYWLILGAFALRLKQENR